MQNIMTMGKHLLFACWELQHRARTYLLVSFLLFTIPFVFPVLAFSAREVGDVLAVLWVARAHNGIIWLELIVTSFIIVYFQSDIKQRTGSFVPPVWAATLPVSVAESVGLKFLSGFCAIATCLIVQWLSVWGVSRSALPLLLDTLLLFAGYAAVLGTLWSFRTLLTRFVLLFSSSAVLFAVGPHDFFGGLPICSGRTALVLVLFVIASYCVTVLRYKSAQKGEHASLLHRLFFRKARPLSGRRQSTQGAPISDEAHAFRTSAQAHLWYEFRRNVWQLPAIVLLVMFINAIAVWLGFVPPRAEALREFRGLIPAILPLIAFLVGFLLPGSSLVDGPRRTIGVIGRLPAKAELFSAAMLKTIAFSVFLSLSLIVVNAFTSMYLSGNGTSLVPVMFRSSNWTQALYGLLSLGSISWIMIALSFCARLSDRMKDIAVAVLAFIFVFFYVVVQEKGSEILKESIVYGFALVSIFIALGAARLAYQEKVVSGRTILFCSGALGVGALADFSVVWLLGDSVPSNRQCAEHLTVLLWMILPCLFAPMAIRLRYLR